MDKIIQATETQTTDLETSLSATANIIAEGSGREAQENALADQSHRQETTPQDPLSYEGLRLPEDISFSSESLESFKQLAREMKLTEEQVQKLLDFESASLRNDAEQTEIQKRHIVERWAEETRALYGAGLEKELSYALRAADAFGGPDLRSLLEDTGLGNHPVIIRTLSEVGKAISEDACPGGKPAAPQDKTFTEALYGKN
jgi:hypothetical protein